MAPSRRNQQAPLIIPFKADFDESEVEYVKHRRSEVHNGVTEEISERVPKLSDDATPYQILKFFTSFAHARDSLQWNTGPRLFQRFRLHLGETHLQQWTVDSDHQWFESNCSQLQSKPCNLQRGDSCWLPLRQSNGRVASNQEATRVDAGSISLAVPCQ